MIFLLAGFFKKSIRPRHMKLPSYRPKVVNTDNFVSHLIEAWAKESDIWSYLSVIGKWKMAANLLLSFQTFYVTCIMQESF